MNGTVECPYCEYENDMSDALCYLEDNTLDWECRSCGEEFEVLVEFEPTYSASKIVYDDCDCCGKSTRDAYIKGRTYPFPNDFKKLCHLCYCIEISKEMGK